MNTLWLDLLGAEVRYRGRSFQTRTLEIGAQNPSKLILIHGVGGHAEAAFTPDMLPMYAQQYIDLLDDLGVQKASIEGESLGGWIALWTALHHPDRVDKIILNTTAGIRWNRDKVKIDETTGTNLLRERSLAAINDPTRETIKKRLEWLMASPDRVTEELVDLRFALYTRRDTNASLKNVFANSFLRGPEAKHFIEEDDLARLTVPAFALWSDKNPGAGADVGERLATLIPGSSHYCIRDAGHWPQWEQPEDHDRVVLEFLAGTRVDATMAMPA
jgi:pimeloyl-ACP methyl ester carboxylesterase